MPGVGNIKSDGAGQVTLFRTIILYPKSSKWVGRGRVNSCPEVLAQINTLVVKNDMELQHLAVRLSVFAGLYNANYFTQEDIERGELVGDWIIVNAVINDIPLKVRTMVAENWVANGFPEAFVYGLTDLEGRKV